MTTARHAILRIATLLILFLSYWPLNCSAHSNEITPFSKSFVSERHSSLFHRPYCRKLFTRPEKISYSLCYDQHLSPCPECIDHQLNQRLNKQLILERIQLEKHKIEARQQRKKKMLARQQALKKQQALKLRNAELARQQEETRKKKLQEEKQRQADLKKIEAEKRRHDEFLARQQYQRDLLAIQQKRDAIQIHYTLKNDSGFTLPKDLFSTDTYIVGPLEFPLNPAEIGYLYTVKNRDPRFHYTVSDQGEALSFLSQNTIAKPIIHVTGKQFEATEKTILFEDHCLKIALHKIDYSDALRVDTTLRNKTKNSFTIETIELSINGYPYRYKLQQPIRLPSKTTLNHAWFDLEATDTPSTTDPLAPLKAPLTAGLMNNPEHTLLLSLALEGVPEDQSRHHFSQFKQLPYTDLFIAE
jgi:hypothetical protein